MKNIIILSRPITKLFIVGACCIPHVLKDKLMHGYLKVQTVAMSFYLLTHLPLTFSHFHLTQLYS